MWPNAVNSASVSSELKALYKSVIIILLLLLLTVELHEPF